MNARQSTAKTFLLGPILDVDGAAKTDEVVGSIKVTKNGTVGAPNASSTLTHDHAGHYLYAANAGDFDTLGEVEFSLNSGTNAMAPVRFQIINQGLYDAMNTAGGSIPANVEQWNAADVANLPSNFEDLAIENTTGRVQIQVGTGDGKLSTTGGAVILQADQAVNVTKWGGTAAASAKVAATLAAGDVSGNLPADVKAYTVQPTVTGATLDAAYDAAKTAAQASALTTADGKLDVIQAKTDNLPSASPGLVGGLPVCNSDNLVASNAVQVGGFTPANATIGTVSTVTDKDGYALSIAGVSAVQSGLSTLDAAGVRGAVGLAAANLDTQLGTVAKTGADGDTLETLSDQIDGISAGSAPTAAEVADAVWDEALAGHAGAGSAGAGLSAAQAAGDPMSVAVPGEYSAGQAGRVLSDIYNKVAGGTISISSPVASTGTITIVAGDDYSGSDALVINVPWSGTSITGGTGRFNVQPRDHYSIGEATGVSAVGTVSVGAATDAVYPVTITLASAATAALESTPNTNANYVYEVEVTVGGTVHTVARGSLLVQRQVA